MSSNCKKVMSLDLSFEFDANNVPLIQATPNFPMTTTTATTATTTAMTTTTTTTMPR